MPVNFSTPNVLNQTPVRPSTSETTESTPVSPERGFHKILANGTEEEESSFPAIQVPLDVMVETPVSGRTADLLADPAGSILDATQQVTNTVTEQVGLSGGAAATAQIALEAAFAIRQDGAGISVGIQAHPLGTGDFEQLVAGLLPAGGKNSPSLTKATGPGQETDADTGTIRSAQQGGIQLDQAVWKMTGAKTILETPEGSVQWTAQTIAGIAGGISAEADNPRDLQAVGARPTADALAAVNGLAGDVGKPAIAAASDTARQSSWLLEQPVHSRNWEDGFGDRILWLVHNRQSVAELRLNPPHLGTIDVRIAVQGDQAQIAFQVSGGAVRDALEAALPRLRDMLAEAGMNLADVGVSDHPSHQDSDPDTEGDGGQSRFDTQAAESTTEPGVADVTAIRNTGQLDLFV